MALADVLGAWRRGGEHHVVAPFADPARFLDGDARTLVVLPTDLEALAWAGGLGAGLLIRTVARAQRTRTLTSPMAPRAVVVSLESLASPVLCGELMRDLQEVAWLLPRADDLSRLVALGAAREEQLRTAHTAIGGAGLLFVHASGALAPADSPREVGVPGALRAGGTRRALAASLLVPPDGGLVAGPDAFGEELGHELGEAGLPRREHDLLRLQARPWSAAIDAVVSGTRGVDAFAAPLGPVPGRAVLRLGGAGSPSALAVPDGAAHAVLGSTDAVSTVDAEAVEACRASLIRHGTEGEWFAVRGDDARAPAALLSDLVAVGALASARPCALAARVADQRRFRPPGVDREPGYRELHDAYQAVMRTWSLAERARLALTDRSVQDLRELAMALGWRPARIADLLLAMNDDGLVTAFVEPLGGTADWEVVPGARWDAAADDLARAIGDLRAGRAAARDAAAAVLVASGCRGQALGEALGVPIEEACGRCDVCDPDSVAWPATLAPVTLPSRSESSLGAPAVARAPTLDSLFSGLGGATPSVTPVARGWTDQQLREALAGGDAAEAAEAAGSAVAAWVRAGFAYSGPGGRRGTPPTEVMADLVQFLADDAAPGGTSEVAGRRAASGSIEIRRRGGGFAGGHRFTVRAGVDVGWHPTAELATGGGLLAVAAAQDAPLSGLRASLQGRTAWDRWRATAEGWLSAQLDAAVGLPDLAAGLPPAPEAVDGPWAVPLAALRLASEGRLDAALEALPDLPGADVVESLLRGALQEWGTLWEAGAETATRGRRPTDPVGRLELRALLGLDPLPELSAELAAGWLALAATEFGPDAVRAGRLVERVATGGAAAFEALARHADPALVAGRALAAGALPVSLLGHVIAADPSAALTAVRGADPDRVWAEHFASRSEAAQRTLIEQLRGPAPDFAEAGEATFAHRDAQAALRQRIVDLAGADELAEVVGLLPRLDSADDEVRAIAARAAAAQRRFTAPLAQALTSDGHDEAGWSALKAAHADGWLDSIVAILRAQARRHPDDARRAVWLARALATGGRWADAELQFQEAAKLTDGLEIEFEGIDLALAAGEEERAGRWMVAMVRSHRGRSAAREITMRAWGNKLPPATARPLLEALKKDGSGVFAGAVRALSDALSKTRG